MKLSSPSDRKRGVGKSGLPAAVLAIAAIAAAFLASVPSASAQEQSTGGVYFDEPYTLLKPFAGEFRRRCGCVENAFALIPRVSSDSAGGLAPLQPRPEIIRYIRFGVDARWAWDAVAPEPRMLITGRGIPPFVEQLGIDAAVQGYLALAQAGDRTAQAELGYLFAVGFGVPQSDEFAAYWYGQAAVQGDRQARMVLAAMYASGRGVPRDEQAAFYWLLDSGNQHLIGDAYACGLGVTEDLAVARAFYEAAADGPNGAGPSRVDAQYQLGMMYRNACGVPLDDERANEWFGKAADAGHPEAQIELSETLSRDSSRLMSAILYAEYALARLSAGPARARVRAARDQALAQVPPWEQALTEAFIRRVLATQREGLASELKDVEAEVNRIEGDLASAPYAFATTSIWYTREHRPQK